MTVYEDLTIDGLPPEFLALVREALRAAYQQGRADSAVEKTKQTNQPPRLAANMVTILDSATIPTEGDDDQSDLPIEAIKGFPWLAVHFLKLADILTAEQLRWTTISKLVEIGIDRGSIPKINQALQAAGFPTINEY